MTQRFHIQISAVLALVGVLAGCGGQADVAPVSKDQTKLVKAITLTLGDTGGYREFPAVVEASEDATLAFRVSGELSELLVTSGQMVQSGQLLAKLDPTDYQIAVDQAQANYDLAKVQYDRAKTLLEKQLASKAGFDEANAQLQVAAAALKSAKTNLAYTQLHAPFGGQVAQRFVENYESVTAQQPVFSLQKNTVVDVAIQIPEDLLSNLDKEATYQPEVRFDTHPDEVFRATLKEYDADADPATNTYKVVFQLPRPDSFNVFPGMSATVRAQLDQVMKVKSGGWNVPASAVFADAENAQQSYVFVITDNMTLEKRAVTLGGISEQGFKVIQGLNTSEQIVEAGVHRLNAGDTVRIWQKERGL